MHEDIDGAEVLADGAGEPLNAVIAVLGIAFVGQRFLVNVGHRIVGDIAGNNLLDLEFAGAVGQLARVLVEIAFEDIRDDVAKARMAGEHQRAVPAAPSRFGDMPGEAAVIADAGHNGQLPGQVEWNHVCLELDGDISAQKPGAAALCPGLLCFRTFGTPSKAHIKSANENICPVAYAW